MMKFDSLNDLFVNVLFSDEEKDLIEQLQIMGDEFELFKTISNRLKKDPGFYYDLDTILDASAVNHFYVGKKHDSSNKNLVIPALHMIIITEEKYDEEDEEWLVKKVEVIRL